MLNIYSDVLIVVLILSLTWIINVSFNCLRNERYLSIIERILDPGVMVGVQSVGRGLFGLLCTSRVPLSEGGASPIFTCLTFRYNGCGKRQERLFNRLFSVR